MSYLKNKNNKIIVDAVLTKYGQSKLARLGTLGITKFAVADDDVDYGLYNILHPQGNDYFDSAIVNMPTLEALPESNLTMKHPLFTKTESPIIDIVSKLVLNYPLIMTSSTGITNFDNYTITPSLSPPPAIGEISPKVNFYIAELIYPDNESGGQYNMSGEIVDERVELDEVRAYYQTLNGEFGHQMYRLYSVGQFFNFKVIKFPRSVTGMTLKVWHYYVPVAPVEINIKVAKRASAPVIQNLVSQTSAID